ncbi:MBOAT family protein [Alphaproteobacteria bacterium]|nr:MBOAT family protein [Alphaproteobacteria bacterium]
MIFLFSLMFYGAWRPEFVLLVLFSILFNYLTAFLIYNSNTQRCRKWFCAFAVGTNLLVLVFFKYLLFFGEIITNIFGALDHKYQLQLPEIILPLGISFFTFQAISYVVDVYRREQNPVKDFVLFACYISFFPQLIAGPILRASEIIGQFQKKLTVKSVDLAKGLKLILFGLFLKAVLADNLAPLVDEAFLAPAQSISAWDVMTMSFLFGYQIYFDFAGYSLIAIGCALLFGFEFPSNFFFPYLASSPRDFWLRWHITLSSWIRDYLYRPLCKTHGESNSLGGLNVQLNSKSSVAPLLLTWMLMGLWHGASWNFVLWGAYHGILVLIGRVIYTIMAQKYLPLPKLFGWVLTLPLIMLGWIPFRSDSLTYCFELWGRLFDMEAYTFLGFRENYYLISLMLMFLMIISYALWPIINGAAKVGSVPLSSLRAVMLAFCLALVIVFLKPVQQFIYFQF